MVSLASMAVFINFFRVFFPESGANSMATEAPVKAAPNKARMIFLFDMLFWFMLRLRDSGQKILRIFSRQSERKYSPQLLSHFELYRYGR